MKPIFAALILLMVNTPLFATELESDQMCQQYISGLYANIAQSEQVGMQALRVSLNRIADKHPQYLEIATQIAFGNALNDEGHRRLGQYINAMCTQKGTVFIDVVYEALLSEAKALSDK